MGRTRTIDSNSVLYCVYCLSLVMTSAFADRKFKSINKMTKLIYCNCYINRRDVFGIFKYDNYKEDFETKEVLCYTKRVIKIIYLQNKGVIC